MSEFRTGFSKHLRIFSKVYYHDARIISIKSRATGRIVKSQAPLISGSALATGTKLKYNLRYRGIDALEWFEKAIEAIEARAGGGVDGGQDEQTVVAARVVVAEERPEARIEVGVQELEVVEDHGGRGRT